MKVFRQIKTESIYCEQTHTKYNLQCHLSRKLKEQTATTKISREMENPDNTMNKFDLIKSLFKASLAADC